MADNCLFCDYQNTTRHEILSEDENAYGRLDDFPVNDGHVDVVLKRHVASFFDLSKDEVLSIFHILNESKQLIDEKFHPDSYNIGINDGKAAGQTIAHVHVHLIPRYEGDVADPRSGVRHVIPGKGSY